MPSVLYEHVTSLMVGLLAVGLVMLSGAVLLCLYELWVVLSRRTKQEAYEKSRRDWRKVHPIISTKDQDK